MLELTVGVGDDKKLRPKETKLFQQRKDKNYKKKRCSAKTRVEKGGKRTYFKKKQKGNASSNKEIGKRCSRLKQGSEKRSVGGNSRGGGLGGEGTRKKLAIY